MKLDTLRNSLENSLEIDIYLDALYVIQDAVVKEITPTEVRFEVQEETVSDSGTAFEIREYSFDLEVILGVSYVKSRFNAENLDI